jgi:hypothetical protein
MEGYRCYGDRTKSAGRITLLNRAQYPEPAEDDSPQAVFRRTNLARNLTMGALKIFE